MKIKHLLLLLILVMAIPISLFMFSYYPVGNTKKMRGKVFLEYSGIIKDKRSELELNKDLNSPNNLTRDGALYAIYNNGKCADLNEDIIIGFLTNDDVPLMIKNTSIDVLGEIKSKKALPYIERLRTGKSCAKPCGGDFNICQYKVQKAIKKINGKL